MLQQSGFFADLVRLGFAPEIARKAIVEMQKSEGKFATALVPVLRAVASCFADSVQEQLNYGRLSSVEMLVSIKDITYKWASKYARDPHFAQRWLVLVDATEVVPEPYAAHRLWELLCFLDELRNHNNAWLARTSSQAGSMLQDYSPRLIALARQTPCVQEAEAVWTQPVPAALSLQGGQSSLRAGVLPDSEHIAHEDALAYNLRACLISPTMAQKMNAVLWKNSDLSVALHATATHGVTQHPPYYFPIAVAALPPFNKCPGAHWAPQANTHQSDGERLRVSDEVYERIVRGKDRFLLCHIKGSLGWANFLQVLLELYMAGLINGVGVLFVYDPCTIHRPGRWQDWLEEVAAFPAVGPPWFLLAEADTAVHSELHAQKDRIIGFAEAPQKSVRTFFATSLTSIPYAVELRRQVLAGKQLCSGTTPATLPPVAEIFQSFVRVKSDIMNCVKAYMQQHKVVHKNNQKGQYEIWAVHVRNGDLFQLLERHLPKEARPDNWDSWQKVLGLIESLDHLRHRLVKIIICTDEKSTYTHLKNTYRHLVAAGRLLFGPGYDEHWPGAGQTKIRNTGVEQFAIHVACMLLADRVYRTQTSTVSLVVSMWRGWIKATEVDEDLGKFKPPVLTGVNIQAKVQMEVMYKAAALVHPHYNAPNAQSMLTANPSLVTIAKSVLPSVCLAWVAYMWEHVVKNQSTSCVQLSALGSVPLPIGAWWTEAYKTTKSSFEKTQAALRASHQTFHSGGWLKTFILAAVSPACMDNGVWSVSVERERLIFLRPGVIPFVRPDQMFDASLSRMLSEVMPGVVASLQKVHNEFPVHAPLVTITAVGDYGEVVGPEMEVLAVGTPHVERAAEVINSCLEFAKQARCLGNGGSSAAWHRQGPQSRQPSQSSGQWEVPWRSSCWPKGGSSQAPKRHKGGGKWR